MNYRNEVLKWTIRKLGLTANCDEPHMYHDDNMEIYMMIEHIDSYELYVSKTEELIQLNFMFANKDDALMNTINKLRG